MMRCRVPRGFKNLQLMFNATPLHSGSRSSLRSVLTFTWRPRPHSALYKTRRLYSLYNQICLEFENLAGVTTVTISDVAKARPHTKHNGTSLFLYERTKRVLFRETYLRSSDVLHAKTPACAPNRFWCWSIFMAPNNPHHFVHYYTVPKIRDAPFGPFDAEPVTNAWKEHGESNAICGNNQSGQWSTVAGLSWLKPAAALVPLANGAAKHSIQFNSAAPLSCKGKGAVTVRALLLLQIVVAPETAKAS